MKDRATVLCIRDGRVLLVARARSRWALPGGRIRRDEAPVDTARRELEEETGLVAMELTYLFQFGGLGTLHNVFLAGVPADAVAQSVQRDCAMPVVCAVEDRHTFGERSHTRYRRTAVSAWTASDGCVI